MSPSPRRLCDFKKKQLSLESNGAATGGDGEVKTADGAIPAASMSGDGKFENISDNGSEISDEGYRSLGIIQHANNSQSKRTSLHSQTSIEDGRVDDAKNNGELRRFMTTLNTILIITISHFCFVLTY